MACSWGEWLLGGRWSSRCGNRQLGTLVLIGLMLHFSGGIFRWSLWRFFRPPADLWPSKSWPEGLSREAVGGSADYMPCPRKCFWVRGTAHTLQCWMCGSGRGFPHRVSCFPRTHTHTHIKINLPYLISALKRRFSIFICMRFLCIVSRRPSADGD